MVLSALKQAIKNAANRKQPISVSKTSGRRKKRTNICKISCFHGLKEKSFVVLNRNQVCNNGED